VAFLTTEAFNFGHCDARYADGSEGSAHFVKLEVFDDGCDQFHGSPLD
jgi:hypothetical protein